MGEHCPKTSRDVCIACSAGLRSPARNGDPVKRVYAEQKTTCEEAILFLGLVVDGEISADELARIDAHLAECPSCQRERIRLEGTKAALRGIADDGEAPPALYLRVQASIARESKKEKRSQRVLAFGVALSLSGFAALGAALIIDRHVPPPDPLVHESFERHALDVPVDIASPDPARLERFLSTRVARPLHVPPLADLGLELHGARVVSVERTHAAHVVYQGALGEKLSVTAIPDPDGVLLRRLKGARLIEQSAESGGLHLRVVNAGGVVFTAVSTLPDDRVREALHAFAR
jgi:anti-sigma factor RsiW